MVDLRRIVGFCDCAAGLPVSGTGRDASCLTSLFRSV
ncbi:hypothetical protein SAMN05421504_112104 [Amycolatopsis xylanica]|uniref:Uncharacterized protein n=1 Tax=Amycolatopsis xylanica TaxID=589385 RepID=A0A1H3S0X4_9PSEU|nr:hypothetical protein SAMN05421504_112104 [Amycolatopsis xylanica]